MTDSLRLPVLALVGRPNVGKSTLFNRLTGTRDALVADLAGLTRDRQYGFAKFEGRRYMVVDTGGLSPEDSDPLAALAEDQARLAIADADRVLFLTDGRSGAAGADHEIGRYLRRLGKPIDLIVNKTEGLAPAAIAEFHALGLGAPRGISAEHGQGVSAMIEAVLADLPVVADDEEDDSGEMRVAIIGRPNVGKSTLVNRLLGEERVLAADYPGTTRDSIQISFEYEGRPYELIDTAGVRRRAKVKDLVEKFSVIKTLQAIERAHVVVAMVDARSEIGNQDARLMGLAAERGRAMILAVNKWDSLPNYDREEARRAIDTRLPFLEYVPVHFISALHGSGLRELMADVDRVYASAMCEMPTPALNKLLEKSVARHAPPAILGRRIKLRYAHQGGRNPPRIVIHGTQTQKLNEPYRRYLINRIREHFQLVGVPLALEFRNSENPYADKPTGRAQTSKSSRKASPSAKPKPKAKQAASAKKSAKPGAKAAGQGAAKPGRAAGKPSGSTRRTAPGRRKP